MFTHVRKAQDWHIKYARAEWTRGDNNAVCACFTDVHTGEPSKRRLSTRKRKIFIFLVIALVFISCPCACSCAYSYSSEIGGTVKDSILGGRGVHMTLFLTSSL